MFQRIVLFINFFTFFYTYSQKTTISFKPESIKMDIKGNLEKPFTVIIDNLPIGIDQVNSSARLYWLSSLGTEKDHVAVTSKAGSIKAYKDKKNKHINTKTSIGSAGKKFYKKTITYKKLILNDSLKDGDILNGFFRIRTLTSFQKMKPKISFDSPDFITNTNKDERVHFSITTFYVVEKL